MQCIDAKGEILLENNIVYLQGLLEDIRQIEMIVDKKI